MYREGMGTEVDLTRALYWFEKSARQGNLESIFNCGSMYHNGEGTEVDDVKAKAYLQIVAEQTEDEELQEYAKEMLSEM